jgi:hypothetical protein
MITSTTNLTCRVNVMMVLGSSGRGTSHFQSGYEQFSRKELRDHLYQSYRSYVIHKKNLCEFGSRDFYRTVRKMKSLDKCLQYVDIMKTYKLENICMRILALMPDLETILPKPTNSAYHSQTNKLTDMRVICKTILNNNNI